MTGTPGEPEIRTLRKKIRADIAHEAGRLLRGGPPDVAAATSKTFRSLARICGAAPSVRGAAGRPRADHRRPPGVDPEAVAMGADDLAALPGVSPSRTHQILPGALVAEAVMDIFDLADAADLSRGRCARA